MTTIPIHTVQHVKSVFRKFQLIAMLFTTITLVAALLAAFSGFQLSKLQKKKDAESTIAPAPVQPAPAPADDGLKSHIKTLENQLAAEKATSQGLRAKIQELEKKIVALKNSPPAQAPPAEPQPAQGNRVDDGKSTPALPALTPPPAQTPASEPAKVPAQTDETAPQKPVPMPETKSMTPANPSDVSTPAGVQPLPAPVETGQPEKTAASPSESIPKPMNAAVNAPTPGSDGPQPEGLKAETLPQAQNSGTKDQVKSQ